MRALMLTREVLGRHRSKEVLWRRRVERALDIGEEVVAVVNAPWQEASVWRRADILEVRRDGSASSSARFALRIATHQENEAVLEVRFSATSPGHCEEILAALAKAPAARAAGSQVQARPARHKNGRRGTPPRAAAAEGFAVLIYVMVTLPLPRARR